MRRFLLAILLFAAGGLSGFLCSRYYVAERSSPSLREGTSPASEARLEDARDSQDAFVTQGGTPGSADAAASTPAAETIQIRIEAIEPLPPGQGRFFGAVRTPEGTPVAGVRVRAIPSSTHFDGNVFSPHEAEERRIPRGRREAPSLDERA
ncbi:MAG: hypothetical protein L0Z55_10725 [Planctomycetes bacterium]|nr:hypothetical protein [Planctomycetota bacterium]